MNKNCKAAATLCWSCRRATGFCPWSGRDEDTHEVLFRPVRGWVAEKNIILNRGGTRGHIRTRRTESYRVVSCPLYIREERRKRT